MKLRGLEKRDLEIAGVLLYESFARATRERGQSPPWADAGETMRLAERYLGDELGESIVADVDGAVAGVGFARRRGEAATVGPIAVAAPRQGIGGQILDELVAVPGTPIKVGLDRRSVTRLPSALRLRLEESSPKSVLKQSMAATPMPSRCSPDGASGRSTWWRRWSARRDRRRASMARAGSRCRRFATRMWRRWRLWISACAGSTGAAI